MRRTPWLAALCLLAFGLSCAYVAYYLRGGPRIVDATSYFLEARSLAAGSFSFHVPDPSGSFRGRFLLAHDQGHELGVIFPPGYPLLLALGVLLGVPLLLGPLLGALLVGASYALARALGQEKRVALMAALLSALCAALRYHTADTMSHGLATLLTCATLTCALRAERRGAPLAGGLCLGLLLATRPVSGAVSVCLVLLVASTRKPRNFPLFWLLGALPGVALLLLQQRALTGSWFSSVQEAYYAVSDAPTNCFRYGFGQGVGCRFEHGGYVDRFLPNGYGFGPALRNFAVRLALLSSDATNAAPLTLLGGYALVRHIRSPLALLGAGILLQALAYVPFYFDGNYPGGGARFLCEAIPFCQILVARAVFDLRVPWLAPLGALAGFALFARHGHEELRDREGGRPMFEPSVVARAGVTRGLVLVGSDHGFNIGHDPRARDPRTGLVVARERGDAHDRLLYDRLGRPPTYRYVFDTKGSLPPRLVPYVPPASSRWETETEWPAQLDQGHAYPIHVPCASQGRALRLYPQTQAFFEPEPRTSSILIGWAGTTAAGAQLRVEWGEQVTWLSARGPGCTEWRVTGQPSRDRPRLAVKLAQGEGALDFFETELTR